MNCVNPKLIPVTNSTGDVINMLVPCGHCYACQNKNRAEWTYRVSAETEGCFSVFLTLSYDDAHIPTFCRDAAFWLREEQKKEFQHRNYGDICYLRKTDFQSFLKKCQKELKKYFNDKTLLFRYILNGEYGDSSKRCHGHAIMIFPKILSYTQCQNFCRDVFNFQHIYDTRNSDINNHQSLHACRLWPHGGISTQYCYGIKGVATYVSKHCTKSCKGTDIQEFHGKSFRMTSNYGGGIGVNQLCANPLVITAYENKQPLIDKGFDGKEYKLSVPRAVVRRLHPDILSDSELYEHSHDAFAKQDDNIGLWAFQNDFKSEDYDDFKNEYYKEQQMIDNKMRRDMERLRLMNRRKKRNH